MNKLNINKPVWKVFGKLPDTRSCISFVNANDEKSAIVIAKKEWPEDCTFHTAHQIDVKTGGRLAPIESTKEQ